MALHEPDVRGFPNDGQAPSFGKNRLAHAPAAGHSDGMDRDPVSKIVADNLRRLLAERGESALALAHRCRLGRSTVYDILDGRSESPRLKTIALLAKELRVPLSDMFLTPEQIRAQSEVLRAYQALDPTDQRRLSQIVRAWGRD